MKNRITYLALCFAVIGCAAAVYSAVLLHGVSARLAFVESRSASVEQRVLSRITSDVREELLPVYRDFGLTEPSPNATLRELLQPLLGVHVTPLAAR